MAKVNIWDEMLTINGEMIPIRNYEIPIKEGMQYLDYYYDLFREAAKTLTDIPFKGYFGSVELINREDTMTVFFVTVVDTKECGILIEKKVIAKDKMTAMLHLDLSPEIKDKVDKGQIVFIWQELGQFQRYTKRVKIQDEEE